MKERSKKPFFCLYTIKIMETTRQQKIARLIQKELGDIFLNYARQWSGTLISVTSARISPDLSVSHVHISVFPTDRAEAVMKMIEENKRAIRYDFGTKVRNQLRIIPELMFHIDDSLDYVENIDRLLKNDSSEPTED